MTTERPAPPRSVPTLTEVVPWPRSDAGERADDARDEASEPSGATAGVDAPAPPTVDPQALRAVADAAGAMSRSLDHERLTERILQDVLRQVEQIVEYRVREALTPVLARLADALVREARTELASTLRDVVARSVAQELRRQRGG